MTSGFLSLWSWLLIGAFLIAGIAVEYSIRSQKRANIQIPAKIEQQTDTASRNIPAREANELVIRHFEDEWGAETARSHAVMALDRLREAAAKGLIVVEGREEINRDNPIGERFKRIWMPISSAFWQTHEFDPGAVLDASTDWQRCETRPENPADVTVSAAPEYAGLRLSEVAIRKLWPSPSWPRPDYKKWDKQREFRLVDLAWLWEDIEPAEYPLPAKVRARFNKLGQDANSHSLRLKYSDDAREVMWEIYDAKRSGTPGKASPEWIASKDDAKSYAYSIDERPPFLFPMERV